MSNESHIINRLIAEGCHSLELYRHKGGWPAEQRAPGRTTWSAHGHGYLNGHVSRANHTYFGYGVGATYTAALTALYLIVRRVNARARRAAQPGIARRKLIASIDRAGARWRSVGPQPLTKSGARAL